jgi:hypothetical protein
MPACCQPSLPRWLLLQRRAARRQRQQLAPTCPKPSRSGGGEGRLSSRLWVLRASCCACVSVCLGVTTHCSSITGIKRQAGFESG